jgi:hypothetical protein
MKSINFTEKFASELSLSWQDEALTVNTLSCGNFLSHHGNQFSWSFKIFYKFKFIVQILIKFQSKFKMSKSTIKLDLKDSAKRSFMILNYWTSGTRQTSSHTNVIDPVLELNTLKTRCDFIHNVSLIVAVSVVDQLLDIQSDVYTFRHSSWFF